MVSTSTDLSTWAQEPFPMPTIAFMAHTSEGILALGMDPCRDVGAPCATQEPQYFLSRDGLTWEALQAPFGPTSFVEGAGGVIGLGESGVYRLTPYTDDEAFLLAGIREDARSSCARRDSLPSGAIAGVECSVAGGPASSVGAFLFPSRDTLLSAYFDRLGDAGVAPASGGCPGEPGDGIYVPDLDPATGPYRIGCFINEFGNANYRITYPDSLVYVGVLGRDGDLPVLDDWVWEGNLGQPGSPTLWRDPG
jgi:hypothetical protein